MQFSEFLKESETTMILKQLLYYQEQGRLTSHESVTDDGFSSHHPDGNDELIQHFRLGGRIQEKLDEYSNEVGIDKVRITNSWFNFQNVGSQLKLHHHAGSKLSAALYINVDENSSKLFFENPNHLAVFNYYTEHNQSEYNHEWFSFQPKKGDLYIFPSWANHSVDANESEEPRISLSFNKGLIQ